MRQPAKGTKPNSSDAQKTGDSNNRDSSPPPLSRLSEVATPSGDLSWGGAGAKTLPMLRRPMAMASMPSMALMPSSTELPRVSEAFSLDWIVEASAPRAAILACAMIEPALNSNSTSATVVPHPDSFASACLTADSKVYNKVKFEIKPK